MKLSATAITLAASSLIALGQLAQAKSIDAPGVSAQSDSAFYTGKPYDADLNAYTFAYREYDPGINRWTTADPSGFPDGANNLRYSAIPTTQVDPLGLFDTGAFFTGIGEISAGIVGINGGIAAITVGSETVWAPFIGAAGIFSGVLGINAGIVSIIDAFKDTTTFIPGSTGSVVGVTLAGMIGTTKETSEALGDLGDLIENLSALSGHGAKLAEKLLSDVNALNSDVTAMGAVRNLQPAVQNGQAGYE